MKRLDSIKFTNRFEFTLNKAFFMYDFFSIDLIGLWRDFQPNNYKY